MRWRGTSRSHGVRPLRHGTKTRRATSPFANANREETDSLSQSSSDRITPVAIAATTMSPVSVR